MQIDYLEIGPTPYGEDCQQVGMPGYSAQRAREECQAFANQLKRIWPDGDFRVVLNRHDFGSYYDVFAYYSNEHEQNIAFEAESNTPEFWDREAQIELGIRPREEGNLAQEHFEAILDKNEMARHLSAFMRGDIEQVDVPWLLAKLETIEKWIGTANQPSMKEIQDHNPKEAGFRI
jgi:hypothetical protein